MTHRTKVIIAGSSVLIALFAVIVVPNFVRARHTSASNACPNNLRQIDGAKQQWALEYRKTTNDTPSWDEIRPYLGRGMDGTLPKCPHGGRYIMGKIGQNPRCTYPGDVIE
jgi:hypothetical protein